MSTSNSSAGSKFGHAVVIGGSMAGMATARVLTDHFERVTLIERDSLPNSPEFRKGAPQARHLHALLKRGGDTFYGLCPDLFASLVTGGGVEVDFGRDMRWYHFGGWKSPCKLGLS